jgi:DNA-binding MarR family transcriptional regulator
MGMESTSLSRALKGMESMGLIERRKDSIDNRSVRVFLTQDGIAARRQARDLVVSVNDRLRNELGTDPFERLLTEMKRLNEILDDPSILIMSQNSSSLSST